MWLASLGWQALKKRAARHGCSAEAEHRALLMEVLYKPRRRLLAEVLAAMLGVGTDADFARVQETGDARLLDDPARAPTSLSPQL